MKRKNRSKKIAYRLFRYYNPEISAGEIWRYVLELYDNGTLDKAINRG